MRLRSVVQSPLRRAAFVSALSLIAPSLAFSDVTVNDTPGTGMNKNHTAFAFAPYNWVGENWQKGPKAFSDKVGPKTGQQYDIMMIAQDEKPDTGVTLNCTVTKFKEVISENSASLGVLLIDSHGNEKLTAVEPYVLQADRDKAYDAYISTGSFTADEIAKTSNDNSFAISVTDKFVTNYRNLAQALIFVDTCFGSTMLDAYAGGVDGQPADKQARVALGEKGKCSVGDGASDVESFFGSLNGQRFLLRFGDRAPIPLSNTWNRSVEAAQRDLETRVALQGAKDTTLAPIVSSLAINGERKACSIKKGDKVTIRFDTNCKTADPKPVLTGTNGIILDNLTWANSYQLEAECTAPEAAVTNFEITVGWKNVISAKNDARLDGNTSPDRAIDKIGIPNGHGPAHDDYVYRPDCK